MIDNNIVNRIKSLIDNNKWSTILKLLENNKLDPFMNIINGNTIVHMATKNNNDRIIKYIIKHIPLSLEKINSDGDTSVHILANNAYYKLLKEVIIKYPKFVNLLDGGNNTVLQLLNPVDDIYSWIIDNYKNIINFSNINNDNNTALLQNINLTKDKNDKYFENIKKIIKSLNSDELNMPKNNPPLTLAVQNKKEYVVNELLKQDGILTNIQNDNHLTPLLLAVYNRMYGTIKNLLKNKTDINYIGNDGDLNPLSLMIVRDDIKMLDIFFDNGFNINQYDRFIETPLHHAFTLTDKLSPHLVAKLLYYGDLNIQNVNGDTPMHLFLKKYNWKDYNQILKKKEIDIFVKNNRGEIPLNYIKSKDISKFLNFITSNYIDKLNDKNLIDVHTNFNGLCSNKSIVSEECLKEVKNHIIKTQTSYPLRGIDDIKINEQFKIIKGKFSNYGKFNANTLHNMIYTLLFLDKYKELCIPYQKNIYDKHINDKFLQYHNNLYKSPSEFVISDLVQMYSDYFYESLPYLIIWRSSNQYYIDKDLDYYLQKCLTCDTIRFIFFKLTIVASSSGTHANILIYDNKTGILDRFEPYGNIPYLESDKLDDMIEDKIGSIIKKHLIVTKKTHRHNIKFKYIRPKDYIKGIGFQTISNDTDNSVKKLGDPYGYCLAWTYWYLEMRLNNPNLPIAKIIKKANESIIQDNINETNNENKTNSIFIDTIRNYASNLDEMKNEYLIKIGISKKYIYNIIMPDSEQDKLVEAISKDFERIIKERCQKVEK